MRLEGEEVWITGEVVRRRIQNRGRAFFNCGQRGVMAQESETAVAHEGPVQPKSGGEDRKKRWVKPEKFLSVFLSEILEKRRRQPGLWRMTVFLKGVPFNFLRTITIIFGRVDFMDGWKTPSYCAGPIEELFS